MHLECSVKHLLKTNNINLYQFVPTLNTSINNQLNLIFKVVIKRKSSGWSCVFDSRPVDSRQLRNYNNLRNAWVLIIINIPILNKNERAWAIPQHCSVCKLWTALEICTAFLAVFLHLNNKQKSSAWEALQYLSYTMPSHFFLYLLILNL